jgi:predicted RNase H-like HicB family nuclease
VKSRIIQIIESYEQGVWSGYSPDLPGFTAVADSQPRFRKLAKEGVAFALGTKFFSLSFVDQRPKVSP